MWEREIVFQKKNLENIPLKISLVFIRVFHWLKIVFRWLFFLCDTKHGKMWKTIYIDSFSAKQTEVIKRRWRDKPKIGIDILIGKR